MNILFLSTQLPYPPDHGHFLRTYNILKHLAKQNNNIYFLSFIKSPEDREYIPKIKELCSSVDVFTIPDDTSTVRLITSLFLNLFSSKPYIAQKYFQEDMKRKVLDVIKNNKIDIIHFDMLHLAKYYDEIKNHISTAIPMVLTEHNVESIRLYRLMRNTKNIFLKIFLYLQYIKLKNFEKVYCPKFNLCITVSENDKKDLEHLCGSGHFEVIPNGVDTAYFSPDPTIKKEPDSIIWIGSMSDLYNREAVDYFCKEIFPLIYQKVPNIKFYAVGSNPSKRLIELSQKNKNVFPIGYVDDVRPFMNKAEIFIAPIKSGGGTKLKVLNALAMAKPVITTTVGAEGIDVENEKNIIIENNPKSFAEKTVYLLKNKDYAAQIGNNGRKLILSKYDWNILGKKLQKIYSGLIDNQPN